MSVIENQRVVKIKIYDYLKKEERDEFYTEEEFILECRYWDISKLLNSPSIDEDAKILALAYFKFRRHTPFYQEYQSRRAR